MTQAAASVFKIPTESPQPARGPVSRARQASVKPKAAGSGVVRLRSVWHEGGERQQCESVSQEKLASKLEKVRERLAAGAANTTKPGADLIAWYLNPDRLPVAARWSRKHPTPSGAAAARARA